MDNVISFDLNKNRTKCENNQNQNYQICEKFDIKGLVAYTGLKYQLLYKIIKIKKQIPYWQIGNKIIVAKTDIDNFMAKHFVQAEANY